MSVHSEKTVLAVDPGSSKCGLAIVRRTDEGQIDLIWRRVVPTAELTHHVSEAREASNFSMIIVGSGTKSKVIVQEIREHMPSIGILVVDETDTSMEARARYWEHHRRRGWRRFLPSTLQVPPEPVDDFVALILAERVLTD